MSILFTPKAIGNIVVKNRFVHSATYEAMASPSGEVTEEVLRRYQKLSRGGVGLIIPGHMYVHPEGKAGKSQTGIHSDDMVPGLTRLAEAAHSGGARVFFQITHAGAQTSGKLIGRRPMGPSDTPIDPVTRSHPAKMTEEEIAAVIRAFAEAARRAAEAGADGVQLHAAHGYLLSQFLSPYLNDRNDAWGGSEENRFRTLKEVFLAVRQALPADRAVIVKINSTDALPEGGVTPELAAAYCRRLAGLGIDGIETSCGLGRHSFLATVRGDTPIEDLIRNFPEPMKPLARAALEGMAEKNALVEGYNLEGAKTIKPGVGNVPLILVGGMRSKAHMEGVLAGGAVDFISLSRPLIREPSLVRRFQEGKARAATCASCNQCFAAIGNGLPVKCYNKTLLPAESIDPPASNGI